MPHAYTCPECGENWPALLLERIDLAGCPDCNPAAYRAWPSDPEAEADTEPVALSR